MEVRFLGHSAVELKASKATILIDPFITGNPVCPVQAADLNPDYILITHFHGDHVGDTEALAKRTGATVITGYDGGEGLAAKGLKVHTMAVGGTYPFPFGLVRMTMAFHGSGTAGGMAAGFVIHADGKRFYHSGDTCLYSDMKLLNGVIEEPGIDLACLPIGDNYTMGPREAAIAAEWIGAKAVIPVHWGTFPILHGRPEAFVQSLTARGNIRPVVLEPGQSYSF